MSTSTEKIERFSQVMWPSSGIARHHDPGANGSFPALYSFGIILISIGYPLTKYCLQTHHT